jgi:hypothetical protein
MIYFQIQEGVELPSLKELDPFKVVLIAESDVSQEWQNIVSEWIVHSEAYYVIAWGNNCSLWDDSVDLANIAQFEDGIPNDQYVTTTWHDDEELNEVFWFAKNSAFNQYHDLKEIVILHISEENKGSEFSMALKNA